MNILLWILQAALAFFYISGGAYKIFSFENLAKMPSIKALPRPVWTALGAIEIAGAIGLIVPAAFKAVPILTPTAASVLALTTLFQLAVNIAYAGIQFRATSPALWNLVLGTLAAFVAYGRFALYPL